MCTTFPSKLSEVAIGAKWQVVAFVQNYFEHAHHSIAM
jgi:hypothetical protein